jgi:hypothetical protein
MFEIVVANDTLELRHLWCLLAAMRFRKAMILDKCEQKSENEEGKRAQSHKNWHRHDEKAENLLRVGVTRSENSLQNSLFWNATENRDCS